MPPGRLIQNFGGNVNWTPFHHYQPQNEESLLSILEQHKGEKFRAVASLHSWSPVAATSGVTIDMRAFNGVKVLSGEESVWLGAGCTIQRALNLLRSQGGLTLPSIGAIKKQTIAGAISTGTHGSGAPGMSHFIQAVRIAHYDQETGEAIVGEINSGEELRAVRCGLGCLGILLEVKMPIRPIYLVEETVRRVKDIPEIVARYSDHPLSFFALAPYTGEFIMWERREIPQMELSFQQRIVAYLYRLQNFVGVDVVFHLLISVLKRASFSALKRFFEIFPNLLLLNKSVVDDFEPQLTLAHDLFQHEEMELFLPEEHLSDAFEFIGDVLDLFAGETVSVASASEARLQEAGLLNSLRDYRGSYLHHYPVSVRRVPPEDTLISMASGDRTWYAVSLFTYKRDRRSYYDFCHWIARACQELFEARLHWGKFCPLTSEHLAPLYPHMEAFREICREKDPEGHFQNEFTRRILGM
jgi:hypothetical protein